MNNLFEFNEDFEVVINPQALTIKQYKDVLDKYKDKTLGISELSFIAFLLHHKSDYATIRNIEERKEAILMSIINGNKLKLDEVTDKAIEFYKEYNHTVTSNYLDSVLDALDKTGQYFRDVDFTKKDLKNALVYDPKKVIDAIKESPKLMQSIRELRELIKKEQEAETGIRGSGQKGIYEDGEL